jgi:anti-sigma factor RsiW
MDWLSILKGSPRERLEGECRAANPLLSPYVDGITTPEQSRRIEDHLPSCEACRRSLACMKATRVLRPAGRASHCEPHTLSGPRASSPP